MILETFPPSTINRFRSLLENSREPAARDLFRSVRRFTDLPDHVLVLPAHGAGSSCGKALGSVPFSTTGYERRFNPAIRTALDDGEKAFVEEILDGQPEPPRYFARMKKLNRSGPAVLDGLPRPSRLAPDDVPELLASSGDRVVFLDTRSDREAFMASHLVDSLFAPLGSKFSEAAGSYVDADRDVYLVVTSESEVEDATRQLVRIGIDRVRGYALHDELGGCEACQPYFRTTQTITTTEIDPRDRILDVRSEDEYESGHVPGAIQVAHTRLAADADELPEPGPLTVHCGSGMRAALATAQLERNGYEVTFANGAFSDWKKQAEEVATGS